MSKRQWVITSIVALVLIAALGAYFLLLRGSATVIPTSDYQVLKPKEFSSRVAVNGSVAPVKTANLYTHLTGPVSALDVRVGDHVNQDQLVAQIDVSSNQRELNKQLAEQNSGAVNTRNQIEQAQNQYNQYKDALDQGLNSQINQAEAALRNADGQFNDAVINFQIKDHDRATGRDPMIRDQANAVNAARTQALTASINAVRAGVDLLYAAGNGAAAAGGGAGGAGGQAGGANGDQGQGQQGGGIAGLPGQGIANGILNGADAINNLDSANRQLREAEATYLDNLAKVDQEVAAAQRNVAGTFAAKREAATGLESAKLAADQQLSTYNQGVQQAIRAAEAGQLVSEQANSQLRYDISSSEIRAPFSGVVTNVAAEQGKAANGALLAVGDDSKLLVRADVKEVDVSKITPGLPVTFTTVGTGAKEFHGRVTSVSSVSGSSQEPSGGAQGGGGASAAAGAGGAGGGGASGSGTQKVTFPIEIEVTGERQGLLIGGTAKAQVITEKKANVLTVPRDAVFTNDKGEQCVLVVAEDSGLKVVAERKVKVGSANDVDTIISGGDLKSGDTVLSNPDSYRSLVGQQVKLDG
ncbi:HlyD family efflux transporter periplasmic adaptor subunit [Corynebacterium durum]|uniref:HlyD family efflux transporter periplasmic adaptor subunit n=1 Tax=Corynebacterium durum TaxID=61592 RepID=UPI0015C83A04|nr:HlyD family efflux transporter periplasmic adaptor subunit [Corynebacterium durum]MDO4651551.1 HlyD family efflux transporter periplasmic adaptor subunit [Corynebacterium durum]NYI74417.1 HlyD family secretion protein [Corynebacterium durum]